MGWDDEDDLDNEYITEQETNEDYGDESGQLVWVYCKRCNKLILIPYDKDNICEVCERNDL